MGDATYWVYILASKKYGTLYVGVTNSIERRVAEHKAKAVSGFTKRYGVDRLVYYRRFGGDRRGDPVREATEAVAEGLEDQADRRGQSALGGFVSADDGAPPAPSGAYGSRSFATRKPG